MDGDKIIQESGVKKNPKRAEDRNIQIQNLS